MIQKNTKFIATCKLNKNNIPAVAENSTMVLTNTFAITANYCLNPITDPTNIPADYIPIIETKTYTVYNFTDQNGTKNLNVVLLHDDLVIGFVYLPDDGNQDDLYFDDLQMSWLQTGVIVLQDPSILAPIEQQIGIL